MKSDPKICPICTLDDIECDCDGEDGRAWRWEPREPRKARITRSQIRKTVEAICREMPPPGWEEKQ